MFPSVPLLQLILIALTAHIALAGARITTSLYALSLHASTLTVGTLIALFSVFPMLFAVPTGRLVDRVGILRPMLVGCAAMVAGCALPARVPSLPALYAATMLIGTGFMVVQVAVQHTVGACSATDKRAGNFSWLALGFSISGLCGPVLAGLLIDHADFPVAYFVFAAFALAALVLVGCVRVQEAPDVTPHEIRTAKALDLLRDAGMRRIYIVGMLLSSAWDLFTFVLPLQGARAGFSASTIGVILGCFSAATFVVRLGMPWIARRLSEWQILTTALAMAACCYAVFPLMQQPFSLTVVAAILGLAVGASQPNMLALLHHAAPAGRAAEAVGMRITFGNACQVALPLAFGGAGMTLGLPMVFWGMGAMIGAGIPVAWGQSVRQQKNSQAGSDHN